LLKALAGALHDAPNRRLLLSFPGWVTPRREPRRALALEPLHPRFVAPPVLAGASQALSCVHAIPVSTIVMQSTGHGSNAACSRCIPLRSPYA
jgi:hypothetical protein